MAKTKTLQVILDEVLREELDRYCLARKVSRADVMRRGIAAIINRPSLANGVKQGRPTSDEQGAK